MSQFYSGIRSLVKVRNRFLLLLLGICLLAVSLALFTHSIGKPYMGIILSMDKQGWTVNEVDTLGLASKAGIRVGDKPVEINGQPAQIFLEKYQNDGMVWGPLIKNIIVTNDRGQLKSVTLEDSYNYAEHWIEPATLFGLCLVFWITGFYVFFKKPKNLAALLFYLCGLIVALVLCANIATNRAVPAAPYIEVIATVFGPWLLMHFFLALPEERIKLLNNRLVYLIYMPAAITLVLFFIFDYKDGQPVMWFRSFRFFEYGAGLLAAGIVAILNYFRSTSLKTRQQMKIVLFGCLAALIPILLLNLLPQAVWQQTIISPGFSILFFVFIPLSMGYAVVTQKLMDIDVIIRRGVIYGSITIVMAIILSGVLVIAANFQEALSVPEEILVALALGGIATALFGPAKKGIETLIDKLFYKDRYDYRKITQSLSTSLNSINDFSNMSRLIVGTIVNTLNLGGGCLFTKRESGLYEVMAAQGIFTDESKQKQLSSLTTKLDNLTVLPNSALKVNPDVSFLIPLVAGEKEVGILCLSQKISRQGFSPDDVYLLQGVASVAAIALHRTMLIRDVSMRDTFVSIASHELRTPLTSIVGYADLLIHRDPPDDTRKQWLKHILNNGNRLTALINDLLNITRIQSGKLNIKLSTVKLSDAISEVLAMTSESTDTHEFIVDMNPSLPEVLIDRGKFGQVIVNLLSNAIKYSPNGGKITIAAHYDSLHHRAVISVSDEGIGISPEDQSSLFTTFHRIQRKETQGIRGSGLGLYIAREWTEAMGGEIWLQSELNKGSTFFVGIPVQNP
jgi:signal transduction histidine kinase